MKEKISALVDGELERNASAETLDGLKTAGEARDTWRSYHLIGDAMRDTRMLSPGFSARVAAKLAAEPTVMAPGRAPRPQRLQLQLLSAAASLAAVALVGWFALGLQDETAQVAKVAPSAAQVQAQTVAAQVAPPDKASDYLYAHQGYSPRNTLQSVAPYVRMVSSETGSQKR